MPEIRNKNGQIIQRSRNLAGIRRYVGRNLIKTLDVSRVGQSEGVLSILFEDGSSYQAQFASYTVLKSFVARWRNVHGAPLTVSGTPFGVISAQHPALTS